MKTPVGPRWTLPHLLRFEQYLKLDDQAPTAALARRDRSLYQTLDRDQQTRPRAYLAWLGVRLGEAPLEADAGGIFSRAYGVTTWVAIGIGVLLGSTLCYGALHYDGTVAVNVAIFLFLLVLPQLIMLALLLWTVLLSVLGGGWFGAWYRPAVAMMQTLLTASWRRLAGHTGGQSHDQRQRQAQLLKQTLGWHGPLFANRALRLFQVLGIAFNVAVLGCFLLLLAVTDRAFGWQSSLTDSAAFIEKLVSTLAWPWRHWWGPGIGYPSLEQIEQTRIVLAGTSQTVAPLTGTAWWPFLLLCVFCYGLVPRFAVYLFAVLREHWLLARLSFATYHYQELWRRMQSIELQSFGQASPHTAEAKSAHTPVAADQTIHANAYVLADTLARYRKSDLIHWLPFAHSDQQLLEVKTLAEINAGDKEPIYLVLEGWQPPIEEVLLALIAVARKAQQQQVDLHLLLLGKPGKSGAKPISPRMAEVWRKKLDVYQQANILVHADNTPGGES